MTLNLSQTLFNIDQQLMTKKPNKNGLGEEMPAYINQAKLSTYYQDNPWQTLAFSTRFCLDPLGGPINDSQGSGARPGSKSDVNIATVKSICNSQRNTTVPVATNGIGGITFPAFVKK
jgi:hypothetical protein